MGDHDFANLIERARSGDESAISALLGRFEPDVRRGEREVPLEVAANQPSASERFQERDRLEQLTEGLSPEETEIVQLRREGRTFEEIAGALGMSERSVRRVIKELLKRMEARQ